MWKIIKRVGLLLFLVLVFLIFRTLHQGGTFKTIQPHEKQALTVIKGMIGAEDITIDHSIRKALVSADDRRSHRQGNSIKGAIYLFDYLANPPG